MTLHRTLHRTLPPLPPSTPSTSAGTSRPRRRSLAVVAATVSLAASLTAGVSAGTVVPAAAAGFERGPAPTNASIEAARGAFAISQFSVSDLSTPGFGSATVYYPTSTAQGTFGVVAIAPGYTAPESSIAWMGPRFASQGFVVITFNTNSRYDQPASRGDQLLAALDYVVRDSRTAGRVDRTRQAVIGHSMGGGGTLEAAKDRPAMEAAIGLTPYNLDKSWPEVGAAYLSVGAEDDNVAPTRSHAIPFYESTTNAERRAYLELEGASHFAPNSSNTTIAKYAISWLKRYVDDDTRYEQFLSPGPRPSALGPVSDYRIR